MAMFPGALRTPVVCFPVQAAIYDHKLLGGDLHSWSDPENGKVEKSTILLSTVPSGTDSDWYGFSLKL